MTRREVANGRSVLSIVAVVLGLAVAAGCGEKAGSPPSGAAASDDSGAATSASWSVRQYDADLTNVHFVNATTGFAVGKRGAILKTGDGGATWSLQSSGTNVLLWDVHALSSSTAIAVGEGGTILRTTNGGGKWEPQSSATLKTLFAVDFVDSQRGIAVGYNRVALTTADGGKTWDADNHLPPGVTHLFDVDFVSTDVAYAVGKNGTIIVSVAGGDIWGALSWTARARGPLPDLFAVSFANSSTGWAVGQNGTILRIENKGAKITQQTSGVSKHLNAVDAAGTTGSYAAVAGADGTILYATQGGATWKNYTSKVESSAKVDLHGLDVNTAVSPLAPIYTVGVRGAIVKSGPSYAKFTAQIKPAVTGKQLRAVHFSDGANGWAAGVDGTVLHTTDGGGAWEVESDSDLGGHVFNGIGNGRVVGNAGAVLYKTGTPSGWFNQSVGASKDLHAVRNAFGWWIVGESGALLWSLNGLNFNFVTGLPTAKKTTTLYDIFFTGGVGWIVGAGGTILKSENPTNVQSGTASWQSKSSGVSAALKGIHLAGQTGYAVGENKIVKTTNGGSSWSTLAKTPPGGGFEDVYVLSSNVNVAWVAGAGGLFRTSDGGSSWSSEAAGAAVLAMQHVGVGVYGWAVGDNGLMLRHS